MSELLVTSQNEFYAVVKRGDFLPQRSTLYGIMKHEHESNSWISESSFNLFADSGRICIINKDEAIYLVGDGVGSWFEFTCMRDAYRYDITGKKLEKIAEMNEAKSWAHGAAAQGEIFVIGGVTSSGHPGSICSKMCEVHNETTDEWQVIAGLKIPHGFSQGRVAGMTSIDGKLYAVGEYDDDDYMESASSKRNTRFRRKQGKPFHVNQLITIECYDPDSNEWKKKAEFPDRSMFFVDLTRSMGVLKGSKFLKKISSPLKCNNPSQSENKNQETLPDIGDKQKCFVM